MIDRRDDVGKLLLSYCHCYIECYLSCIMYIEIQYYDLLAVLSYYTILFIKCYVYCIVYIWAIVTHGMTIVTVKEVKYPHSRSLLSRPALFSPRRRRWPLPWLASVVGPTYPRRHPSSSPLYSLASPNHHPLGGTGAGHVGVGPKLCVHAAPGPTAEAPQDPQPLPA
jgi:hypothetical protein